MAEPLILAIDQGTGSTKALLVDRAGIVRSKGQSALAVATPSAGCVEQDARAIWDSVRDAIGKCVSKDTAANIVAIGLSTQRESCLLWDRATLEPLSPLLSWQDQRTLELARRIGAADRDRISAITGLPLDPMFSALKAQWLLNAVDPDRRRSRSGEICVGTIDSFLLARFGGGHQVEIGNAARMQLVDLTTGTYDEGLLDLFDIPLAALPRVVASAGAFGRARGIAPLLDGTPVTGVLGDSHAALFAHGAHAPGKVKATQGTGSSVMGLYDSARTDGLLDGGLCRTIAWQIDRPALAFEGNIRSVGSTLSWLADMFGIDADALAALAQQAPSAGDAALVPAFGGLGAPWWDAEAVGLIGGLTLGTSRAQIARAAIDSIAHQITDVIDRVRLSGVPTTQLHVDGGPTRNDALMQSEADLADIPVFRPHTAELSAMGAAHMAGLGAKLWTLEELQALERPGDVFMPAADPHTRRAARRHWLSMIDRSRGLSVRTRTRSAGADNEEEADR